MVLLSHWGFEKLFVNLFYKQLNTCKVVLLGSRYVLKNKKDEAMPHLNKVIDLNRFYYYFAAVTITIPVIEEWYEHL